MIIISACTHICITSTLSKIKKIFSNSYNDNKTKNDLQIAARLLCRVGRCWLPYRHTLFIPICTYKVLWIRISSTHKDQNNTKKKYTNLILLKAA